MISLRRHSSGHELLIAACDDELLGKTFEEGEIRLDVSQRFYGGEKMDRRLLTEVLALATIGNLVGKETVDAAIEAGFVDPECVLWVKGVPHAQMARM
jgi:hypothetical protein